MAIKYNPLDPFGTNSLFANINKTNQQVNSMNLPMQPTQPKQDFKRQKYGNMMLALSDVLRGQNPSVGVMQRQALIDAEQKEAERKADIEAFLENNPQYRQAYKLKNLLGISAPDRKIIKGADGFNYYADGTRVLPNVVANTETSKRKTIQGADGFNYFVDTGERVLPEVVQKNKASDRKYEKAGDGFFRYIDDGTKVFGDVEIRDPNFVNPTPDNPMGLNKKEIFDRSDKLSDDFRAESKNFIVARDSMKRILDAANNPSPFGDLSIIFSAMKVLDPNSVVRESEFKTVADAAPLLVRLGFSADKIEAMTAGKKLTDAQRADVVGTVIRFFDSATQSQKSLEEYYGDRATGSGLKPEDVIFDYGATVVPKIQNFQFIVSLQNLTPEQLRALDTTAYTKEQKEIYLKELKKLNQ